MKLESFCSGLNGEVKRNEGNSWIIEFLESWAFKRFANLDRNDKERKVQMDNEKDSLEDDLNPLEQIAIT